VSVLLTGFVPFAGDEVNSSWLAVQRAVREWRGPDAPHAGVLPVEFGAAAERMDELLERYRPDVVIATGLAVGRDAVTPERIAINVDDARIPDNAGRAPIDRPIITDGPAAYFTTLPIKAAVDAVEAAGIRSRVSQTAGTFVCNHVFYHLMHVAHATGGMRAGFVHVPVAAEFPSDVGVPTMPLADIATALTLIVRTCVTAGVDARITGGAIS
jgi:pyroglutamyl-peptidase